MDLPIPPSFKLGDAKGLGDCFYDAVAQGLNQIRPKYEFTVKSLRMLCKNYAKQQMGSKSSWLRGALENKTENQQLDNYVSCIEYCADDFDSAKSKVMPLKLRSPVWGRAEIEGRIICGLLNVRLHVIEKHIARNETIRIKDEVIDKDARILNKDSDHSVPLLGTKVQHNKPMTGFSISHTNQTRNACGYFPIGMPPRNANISSNGQRTNAQCYTGINAYNDPNLETQQSMQHMHVIHPTAYDMAYYAGIPATTQHEVLPLYNSYAQTFGLIPNYNLFNNPPMERLVIPKLTNPAVEKPKPAVQVWNNQIIDGSGSRSIDSVDYDASDTIHIVNSGDLHFNPILRKEVVPNQESDSSSSSSSEETKAELGENLIKIVRSQVSEREKVAAMFEILQQGGDVNFKDANRDCNTAMHFAVKLNLPKVFKFLWENGADACLKNSDNKTPLEMASPNQSNIYTEMLNSVSSKDDANTRKLGQIEIDAIILKEFIAPRSHLEEIKDAIAMYGHSLTDIESKYVNDQYLDLCLKYWLQEIRATMLIECSHYTTSDIKAIQTLDQVPAPFREAGFYKRLIQCNDLLDEDHKKFYVTCFRYEMLQLADTRKTFSISEIEEILCKLVHDEEMDLEQVKYHFNHLANNRMNETNLKQIEHSYIDCCLKWFLQEAGNVRDLGVNQIQDTLNKLPGITKLSDIEENKLGPFHEILGYKLALRHSGLIVEKLDRDITLGFKAKCLDPIISRIDTMNKEVNFLQSLSKYLDRVINTDAICTALSLTEFRERRLSFQQLLMKINDLNDKDENLSVLKNATKDMIEDKQMVFEDKLMDFISKYVEEPKIETETLDARVVIEVTGYNITISKVIAKVEEQLRRNGLIEEVRFVASSTVHNDRNLTDPSIWHGKNIVVKSRILQIHGCVTWDVSGRHSDHIYISRANDGREDGEHGHNGADGKAGESGGNVHISVKEIENSQNFTIVSLGGNGGKGQYGGNGKDGADGNGITWDVFQNNFPPPCKPLRSSRPALVLKNIRSMQEEIVNLQFGWYHNLYGHYEIYDKTNKCQSFIDGMIKLCEKGKHAITILQGTTRQGCEITFAYHCGRSWMNSQSYLLCKGGPGKEGCPGGQGGQGGEGGYRGRIKVLAPNCSVHCISDHGNAGENGKGGLRGRSGKVGWDMGYMDYSEELKNENGWFSERKLWPQYFGNDQTKKLQITYYHHNDYTRVTCPYRWSNGHAQRYVRITEVPEPQTSMKMYHEPTQDKETKEKQVQAIAERQKAISYSTVRNLYSRITQNNFILNLGLDELKNKALEQMAEIENETTGAHIPNA